MMPLAMMHCNEPCVVQKVLGKPDVVKHLADLGICTGAKIEIVQYICGNAVVAVRGSRIALDRSLMMKIMV